MNSPTPIEEKEASEVQVFHKRRDQPMDYVYHIKDKTGRMRYQVTGYNDALYIAQDLLDSSSYEGYAVIENTFTGEYFVLT